jgi:hypothetical protein
MSKITANNSRDLELRALVDAELDMISGGATNLFHVKIPGLVLDYYDNGTAVGTSWWGTVINANGNVVTIPGASGGI